MSSQDNFVNPKYPSDLKKIVAITVKADQVFFCECGHEHTAWCPTCGIWATDSENHHPEVLKLRSCKE